jgi:hypothetical protein
MFYSTLLIILRIMSNGAVNGFANRVLAIFNNLSEYILFFPLIYSAFGTHQALVPMVAISNTLKMAGCKG